MWGELICHDHASHDPSSKSCDAWESLLLRFQCTDLATAGALNFSI